MLIKKEVFEYNDFGLECGRTIPLRMGYETYGKLNEKKDNCILVSHYFTATSHAAGVYTEKDEIPGYWDGLIGPGKAIDTDKYFVVSCDNLCNIQIKDPYVITTGPASTDPKTGKPYGLSFPPVSTLDLAYSQLLLLKSLGIEHVEAVAGPSLGGMVAMQIAVHEPDFADKFIGVVTAPYNYIGPSFQYAVWDAAKNDPDFNNGDYYGKAEPVYAIETVCKNLMLTIYSADYLEKMFERDPQDEAPYHDVFAVTCFEKKLAYIAKLMSEKMDMNSWIYASHITMNHDIRHGFKDLDDAAGRIKAKTLLISNRQDNLENWHSSEKLADAVNRTGGNAKFVLLDDELGHMAGMMKTALFSDEIKDFLEN